MRTSSVTTFAAFGALLVACEPRPTVRTSAPGDANAPDAALSATTQPEPSWAELVRRGRFAEASRVVEQLPEAERNQPEVRYLRARLAIARGDGNAALKALEGLETAMPLLAQDVLELRADAALAAGRFKEAGEALAARPTAASQLKASRAFERALDATRARGAADRVVSGKSSRAEEAEARARRLRLGGRSPREDAEDARWLAVEAPDLPDGEGALARLSALDPTRPLTSAERQKRARALGEAGMVDEAIKTLESIPPGETQAARLERLRARAEVYYKSRHHPLQAARAFDDCANLAGPSSLEDAFKAARALSRGDHDDEAIERFVGLARRAPKSPLGEEALYLAGRLHLLHGRATPAAALLDEHHTKHGAARKDAARLRALAHLMANHYATAIRLFEELSDDEREPLTAARARTMAALAALKNGDRTLAIARWSEVARSRPLSWPALVARAHLRELKAPVPPSFEKVDAPDLPPEPLEVNLPPPVDALHRIGLEDEAETALREREPAVTAFAPGRSTEALCLAYAKLGRGKRQYQVAQQIPQAILFAAPTKRTRWSWECAYPSPFDADVRAEETSGALPPGLVHAVMRQESGFDPDAQSPARAVGLLQLMPDTAKTVATAISFPLAEGQLAEPAVNIRLGARYLHDMNERFRNNVALAVASYNGGPDAINKWLGRLRGIAIDIFIEQIPYAETRAYVVKVMGNLARYAYLRGGEEAIPEISLAPLEPTPEPASSSDDKSGR